MINPYPFPSGYLDTYFLDNAPIVFYSDTAYQVRYFYITNGRFVPYDSTVAYDGLQLPEITPPSYLEGYTFTGWKTVTGDLYDISSPFSLATAEANNWLDSYGRFNLYPSYVQTADSNLPEETETTDLLMTILNAFGFGSTEGKAIVYAGILVLVTIISLIIVTKKNLPNFLVYGAIIVWNVFAIANNLIPFFISVIMVLISLIIVVIMLKIKDRSEDVINE